MNPEAQGTGLSGILAGVAGGLGALAVIALFFLGFLLAPGLIAIALLIVYLAAVYRRR